ncbi:hypothetical protein [Streptomyces pseudovenezuelae]|uniref:hypothetical protein n=1 Tax=Streptomyces pseudovenezuelae TaxID=67350 RepID=UPI002E81243D|nr:hypothetical protein [Streptomyces pseudovenezuelae]WUA94474.1 hypothetical protein OHO81_44675 [Streptomyces pseudovenezuelae]
MATRTSHLVDNVHPVPRTANYHYAAMRRAEDAGRGLSVQHSARRFAGAFDPDTTPESLAELAAARDSYYLLAIAHRQAARRIERNARWALAWSDFKANPFLQVGIMAGDRARGLRRKASRLVRTIRRAVSR